VRDAGSRRTLWQPGGPGPGSAGEALTVPAEVIHAVRNVGTADAAQLTAYVVESEPLLIVAA